MSASYTYTDSTTFTVTHARHMAAKVATDLKRIQRLYGVPPDERIAAFEAEVIALLKLGYLGTATFGYRRGEQFIEPTVSGSASRDSWVWTTTSAGSRRCWACW